MKTIINKIGILSFVAMMFFSCKEKEDLVIVSENATASTISAKNTTVVLSKQVIDDIVATFTWTRTDFGYSAGVSYSVQVDKKGNNFAAPRNFVVGTFAPGVTPSKEFKGLEFNNLLLALNLPTGVASQVEVRIKSEVTTLGTVNSPEASVAPVYSVPVTLTVTPFALTSFLYVPGAYQNWTPATADSLISPTGNGVHEGIINFTAGNLDFKVLSKKSWGPPEYGSGATAGIIAIGGGNLTAPAAGKTKVTVDLNANTIAFAPYSWGVIGSATPGGWDNDTDMSYNNGTQTWSVNITLTAGEIKFRLNDAWSVNYGGSGGTIDAGAGNIPVAAAGTYKVEMNIPAKTYTLTKL